MNADPWNRPPLLDMTPDGRIRTPRRPSLLGPLVLAAGAVALVAGAFTVAALALWFAVVLLPVAAVAGVVAYAGFRLQLWRLRRAGRSPGRWPPARY